MGSVPTLIIGAGPVGMTIARALRKRGVPLLAVASRQKKKAAEVAMELGLPACRDYLHLLHRARLVLLAVRDDCIESVAEKIHESALLSPPAVLGHFSGVLSSEALKRPGTSAFSLHPLYSFAARANFKIPKGLPMVCEGDRRGLSAAKALCGTLGGTFVSIDPKAKVLYHAAATLAGNFQVTLAWLAAGLNRKAGIPKEQSLSILFPLLEGTLQNLKTSGLPHALTGPVQRGDFLTVEKHLEALNRLSPELARLYARLSLETLKLAKEKELPHQAGQALKRLLEEWT